MRMRDLPSLGTVALAVGFVAWIPDAFAARWDFDNGWVVNFDSLISVGATLRTVGTNCSFVGNDNGGCVGNEAAPLQKQDPTKFTVNLDTLRIQQDDGDLNYKRWQAASANTQWVGDFAVRANDGWSGLLRGALNYDATVAHTQRTDLDPSAKSFAAHNPRLLDAFITKDTDIFGHQTRVRVGNQVISWGEDIYILGGINSINPIYVPGAHSAGTPIKTLFLPAPMFALNTEIVEGLGFETFYQWKWNSFTFDAPGTFFSTLDVLGKGGRALFYPTSLINNALGTSMPSGTIGDTGTYIIGNNPQTLQPYNRRLTLEELANPNTNPLGTQLGTGTVIVRGADREPKAGQYGAAIRYKSEESGNEAGLYYYRYDDKIPYGSYTLVNNKTNLTGLELDLDYGEKRDLYGLSYNFQLGDWVVGTEASYRPRDGVSIDPSSVSDTSSPYYCANYSNSNLAPLFASSNKPFGTYCRGWIDTANYQFHVAGIQVVSPSGSMGWLLDLMHASESILIVEAAGGYYPNLKLDQGIPYATTADYTQPTRSETGAVFFGSLTWPNIFGTRASLMPDLVVSQGISGYPATALPGFIKGVGAETFGLNIDFKTKPATTMRIDHTQNWGGGAANLLRDRNFMTVSISTGF